VTARRILFTADRLFDGKALVRPAAVIVDGDRIAAVGADLESRNNERLDFAGATILPGLIDCHVHLSDAGLPDASVQDADPPSLRVLRMAGHARRTIEAGFTTVRDVGGRDHLEFGLRRAIEGGLVRGPRLILAGKIVSMTTAGASSWRGMYRQANGVWDVTRAVREQVAAGADVIKLMATGAVLAPGHERPGTPQLTKDELEAIVRTAHGLGRRVAAHAHGIDGIRAAVAAGVDTIEHGTHLHEDRDVARDMRRRGIFLVPTLTALEKMAKPEGPGIPADILAKARERLADRDATFGLALEEGLPIAMGTDAATPFNRHGENAGELVRMVELGMAPADAIASATSAAARALGRDDLGVLRPGALADLAIWDGDPLADIRRLVVSPRAVFVGGERLV
jgi:imidazolonepropionase-like amidohydrolase